MAVEQGVQITKNVYIDNLNNYLKELDKELDEINRSLAKHKSFLNTLENRKSEITIEMQRVSDQISEINKANSLGEMGMDGPISTMNSEAMNKVEEETIQLSDEIDDLKQQYANSEDFGEKAVLQRRIDYKNEQLKRLDKKLIRIGKRQRTITFAKAKIDVLKSRGKIKQSAKMASAEIKADEIQDKIDNSKNSDNIVSTLIEKGRELRVKYYRRKAENARAVLDKMDSRSFIKGARAIAIAKVQTEKLRERMRTRENKKEVNDMVNQPNTNLEKAQATHTM